MNGEIVCPYCLFYHICFWVFLWAWAFVFCTLQRQCIETTCNTCTHLQKKLWLLIAQSLVLAEKINGRFLGVKLGTCELFFSFESNRPSDSFSNRIFELNRPYTMQAVTQPNGLQAYQRIFNLSVFCICDDWQTRVMYGLRNSELSTCLFQFSSKTRQTILLYAYFTPKVDFKRKFNHYQSFLYEWRLTARMIRKFRIGPSIRIESQIGRTITKLRRSLVEMSENILCDNVRLLHRIMQ